MSQPRVKIVPSDLFDVVVSGGGPVALASALEAAKLGKRIAIISDRELAIKTDDAREQAMVFSRGQRIHLDADSRNYLLSFFPANFRNNPEDVKFFESLKKEISIKTRHIERFLLRRLQEENKKRENNVTFFNKQEIKLINMDNGRVMIGNPGDEKNKRVLRFTHLIAADGAKHHAVNVLNKDLHKEVIKYDKIVGPRYPYHGSFAINIKSKDGTPIKIKSQFIEAADRRDVNQMYLSGISLNYKKDSSTVKCVIGTQIPQDLYNKIDAYKKIDALNETKLHPAIRAIRENNIKEEVLTYLSPIIAKELNLKSNSFDISFRQSSKPVDEKSAAYHRSKDKLNLTAFKTDLVKANKAYYKKNDKFVTLGGDTLTQPNYQYGTGMNHGFKHARYLRDVFKSRSLKEYESRCNALSKETERNNWVLNSWLPNLIGKKGDEILLEEGNKRPGKVQQQFNYMKHPRIPNIIQPIHNYIMGSSFMRINKLSAEKLLNQIYMSDQSLKQVIIILHTELKRVNNKWFSLGSYKERLQTAYQLATKAYALEVKELRAQNEKIKPNVSPFKNTSPLAKKPEGKKQSNHPFFSDRKNTLPWEDTTPTPVPVGTPKHRISR